MRAGCCVIAVLGLGLLIASPVVGSDAMSGMPNAAWEIGSYWTFETTATYPGGRTATGSVTYAVLGRNDWLLSQRWAVGVIREGYGGVPQFTLLDLPTPWTAVQWPIPAEFVSGAKTATEWSLIIPASVSGFPAATGRPVRIEGVLGFGSGESPIDAAPPDWLPASPGEMPLIETMTLIPGEATAQVVGAEVFADVVEVQYEWEAPWVRVSGTASWSPELAWWLGTEGHELDASGIETLTFRADLVAWGVLGPEDLQGFVANAVATLPRCEGDPDALECAKAWMARSMLAGLGFDLP